jgi:hypothetical protein
MDEEQRSLDIARWKRKPKAGFYPVLPKDGKPRPERRKHKTHGDKLLLRRNSSPTSLRRLERYFRIKNNLRSATQLNDFNENNSLDAELMGKQVFKYLHPTRGWKVKGCL